MHIDNVGVEILEMYGLDQDQIIALKSQNLFTLGEVSTNFELVTELFFYENLDQVYDAIILAMNVCLLLLKAAYRG